MSMVDQVMELLSKSDPEEAEVNLGQYYYRVYIPSPLLFIRKT